MGTRATALDYAGAGSRIDLIRGSALGRSWVCQPKVDGAYCRVHLDAAGRVERVFSRTGAEYGTEAARSLRGCFLGYPGSELVGELDDHTESGLARFNAQGFAQFHAFDAIRVGRQYVADQPYRSRRDALLSMVGDLENVVGLDRPWTDDASGRAHAADGTFTRRIPQSWRRLEVVPQVPAARAQRLMDDVLSAGGEGIVFVNASSRLGAKNAKRKCKPIIDVDCVVLESWRVGVTLHWTAGNQVIRLGTKRAPEMATGDVVTVLCDGFDHSGRPRHPRIDRVRTDLAA